MDPEENRTPIKPVEPGLAYCRCGRLMRVKPARLLQRLGLPGGRAMQQLLRECDFNAERVKEALSVYNVFECWGLTYRCSACGIIHSNYSALFTEEEAREVAARNGAP